MYQLRIQAKQPEQVVQVNFLWEVVNIHPPEDDDLHGDQRIERLADGGGDDLTLVVKGGLAAFQRYVV